MHDWKQILNLEFVKDGKVTVERTGHDWIRLDYTNAPSEDVSEFIRLVKEILEATTIYQVMVHKNSTNAVFTLT